ncbi:MAG: GNAT family N-acetyltransferase [Bacillota bacterium]
MPEFSLRPVTSDDAALAKLAELFGATWSDQPHLDLAYLRWLYRDNPRGPVIGFNAWVGGNVAGHYAVIPILALHEGETRHAALSLNTAVHPEHQGKGLFTRLAADTYALAARQGVHHVVGVANANSSHGFTQKLGFQLISPLKARFVSTPPREPAATAAWEQAWSPEVYRWRLARPHARYRWSRLHGSLCWWSATHVHGIQALMQYGVSPPYDELLRAGVPRGGWNPLRMWIGLEPEHEPRGFDLPAALRRSPLNLIFKPLQGGAAMPDPRHVRFSLADFDAY